VQNDKQQKGEGKMKVRIKLVEEMLGTASANPDIHKEFIASKSADAKKCEEEMKALNSEELMEKAMTVFPRDADGTPILFDYQIKGFFKDAVGLLLELSDKEVKVGKTKLSKYTFKRVVDNYLFVSPRKIRLAPVGPVCTRPLRADTMKGERVSLVSSETVPEGTMFEFEVTTLAPALADMIIDCLNYGALKGIGQWRNSGKGRFTWEEVK
jgi:hypothetical protein